jgi:hypothetical protein
VAWITRIFLGKLMENLRTAKAPPLTKGGRARLFDLVRSGRDAVKKEKTKKNILGFMYAERLKSALIIAGQLLDGLQGLKEEERAGGLKLFTFFIKGVSGEMQLAANVMVDLNWDGLSGRLNLMEGCARLGQMEAARQELSHTLSRITTLGGRAMTSLKKEGLL